MEKNHKKLLVFIGFEPTTSTLTCVALTTELKDLFNSFLLHFLIRK